MVPVLRFHFEGIHRLALLIFFTCTLSFPVQGIIPNPAEMIVLDELTSELFEALSAENDTNVTNPNPPTGEQHTNVPFSFLFPNTL